MVEIIINDGFLGGQPGEERIIKLISGDTYNDEEVEKSVEDIMRFFYRYTSAGFVDELTRALNQRGRFDGMNK